MAEQRMSKDDVLRVGLDLLDQRYKELDRSHEDLQAQSRRLLEQNQKLRTQNNNLISENQALSSKNASLEEELEKWSVPKAKLSAGIEGMRLTLSTLRQNCLLLWPDDGGEEPPEAKREKEKLQQISQRLDEAADPSFSARIVWIVAFIVKFTANIYTSAAAFCLNRMQKFYERRETNLRQAMETDYEQRRQTMEADYDRWRQTVIRESAEQCQAVEANAKEQAQIFQREMSSLRQEAERERSVLEKQLAFVQDNLSSAQTQMVKLEEQKKVLVQESLQLKRSVQEKGKELSGLQASLTQKESELQQMEKLVQKKEQAITGLKSEVQRLEGSVREKNGTISTLNSKIKDLDSMLADRDARISKLSNELASARQAFGVLFVFCILMGIGIVVMAAG